MRVTDMMRRPVRQILSCLVILAVTIQIALAGAFAASAVAGPGDPFSVICHSGSDVAPAADNSGSTTPASSHSCCDNCILSHVAPGANAPDEAAYLLPLPRSTRLALVLTAEPRRATLFHHSLARGPPSSV
jgi:hypothetical protein